MLVHINAQTEHDPDLAEWLIERATAICGTREALAKRVGLTTKGLRDIAVGTTRMRYPIQLALELIIQQAEPYGSALISHARMYATAAHETISHMQVENVPDVEYPHIVASLVATHYGSIEAEAEHTRQEAIAAAWLHNVIEHTGITLEILRKDFPISVTELVRLASTPRPLKGESLRAYLRRTNRMLAKAPVAAQTIKAANILGSLNLHELTKKAGNTSITYLESKRAQLAALNRAPNTLKQLCEQALEHQASKILDNI